MRDMNEELDKLTYARLVKLLRYSDVHTELRRFEGGQTVFVSMDGDAYRPLSFTEYDGDRRSASGQALDYLLRNAFVSATILDRLLAND